jgi:hypothetical protein
MSYFLQKNKKLLSVQKDCTLMFQLCIIKTKNKYFFKIPMPEKAKKLAPGKKEKAGQVKIQALA